MRLGCGPPSNCNQALTDWRVKHGFDATQPWNHPAIVEAHLSATECRSMQDAAGAEPGGDSNEIEVVNRFDTEARRREQFLKASPGVAPIMVESLVERTVDRRQRRHEHKKCSAWIQHRIRG